MSQQEFEHKIKNIVYSDTADVDIDELWNTIQKKKKRHLFPIWWIGSLALILLIGAALMVFSQGDSTEELPSTSAPDIYQESAKSISRKPTIPKSNTDLLTGKEVQEENITNTPISTDLSNLNTNDNKNIFKNNINQSTSSIIESKTNISQSKSVITPHDFITSDHNTPIATYKTIHIPAPNKSILKEDNLSNPNNKSNDLVNRYTTQIKIPSLKINRLKLPLIVEAINYQSEYTTKYGTYEKPASPFTFEVYGALLNTNRSSEVRLGRPDNSWQFSSENIKPLESWQTGVSLHFLLLKSFYVNAGLQYQKTTEQVANVWTRIDTVAGENPIEIIYLSNGTIDTIYGGSQTTQTSTDLKIYNSIVSYNFPVSIGYISNPIILGLKLRAEAGLIFNISTSSAGQVFQDDQTIVNLNDHSILKDNLGMSYQIKAGVVKLIHKNWSIGLLAQYQSNFKSVNTDEYPHNIRYAYWGLNTSVMYTF